MSNQTHSTPAQRHPLAAMAAATAACLALLAGTGAQAGTTVLDVAGADSIGLVGSPGNTVWLVDIGADMLLTAVAWNVVLTAYSPSLLSELQVGFGSSSGLDQLVLSPALGADASGSGSWSGMLDLTGQGVGSGADGLLRIEFSEAYKDLASGVADGRWDAGSLTFTAAPVPEPASWALLLGGLGVLGWAAARARQGR